MEVARRVSREGDAGVMHIPIQNSSEVIELKLAQLPDAAKVLDAMKSEYAPLSLWLRLSVEYYKRGMVDQFLAVMRELDEPETKDAFKAERFKSDRVAGMNMKAAYHTRMALMTKEKEKREQFLQMATDLFNTASQVDIGEATTYVGKGLLLIVKGDLAQAESNFNIALDMGKANVAAILGKALCLYRRKQFKEALACYRSALRANPVCPPYIRLGIGLCLFKLQRFNEARAAFERVVQLDDENEHALVCLAIIRLNRGEGTEQAFRLVERAYRLDPNNPVVLNLLAQHFFFRGDHERVRQLAERGLKSATLPELEADLLFQIARSFHVQRQYDRAFNHYSRALDKDAGHQMALLGLGQMHMQRKAYDQAVKALSSVYEHHPENGVVVKVLARAYVLAERHKDAAELLARGVKRFPYDIDMLCDLAQACERHQPAEAYTAYARVIEVLRRNKFIVPKQLLNNFGATCHALRKFGEAEDAYLRALGDELAAQLRGVREMAPPTLLTKHSDKRDAAAAGAAGAAAGGDAAGAGAEMKDEAAAGFDGLSLGPEVPQISIPLDCVTLAFNLALCWEAQSLFPKATALYKLILRQFDRYFDCYLRLGTIARKRGDYAAASWFYKKVLAFDKSHVDASTMLGAMCMERGDMASAEKWFGKLSQRGRGAAGAGGASGGGSGSVGSQDLQRDNYAKVAMGNIALLRADGSKEENRRRAAEWFCSVLKHDPHNVYAANGLGAVLAKEQFALEAKEAFAQVREARGDIPDVWVNLAHVYVAQQQYALAIKMYQDALTKFSLHRDALLLLYLARAYFLQGASTQCRSTLMKAIHISPNSSVIWFNLALAQEDHSVRVLEKSKASRTLHEVEGAILSLQQALAIFTRLAERDQAESRDHTEALRRDAHKHALYCKAALPTAEKHLRDAERQADAQRRLREEVERARLQVEARMREAEQAKLLADEEEKRRLEEALRQDREQLERIREQHARSRAEMAAAGAAAGAEDDGFVMGENAEADDEYRPGAAKRARARKAKRAAGDDDGFVVDDEEEEQPPAPTELADKEEEEEEEEEEEKEEEDEEEPAGDADGGDKTEARRRRSKKRPRASDGDAVASAPPAAAEEASEGAARKQRRVVLEEEDEAPLAEAAEAAEAALPTADASDAAAMSDEGPAAKGEAPSSSQSAPQ